jgi:glycosyltransferase involved in cell wall biosynthesis
MKVTLLIPTLNEIGGMKAVMPLIKKEWYDQLLIVDGNSTDGTVEFCKEQGYPVYIQKQKGMRFANAEVWGKITGDIVVTFSPDGNSIPELIPELVKKMKEGYDMVIVSRYKDGAKSQDDDLITGFGNWVFTTMISICHGFHYTDAMVIYRAYKTSLAYDLNLNDEKAYALPEKWFNTRVSWEPLLSIRAARKKLKIAEIPGDEPPRVAGKRKLQILPWGAVFLCQNIREMFVTKYR